MESYNTTEEFAFGYAKLGLSLVLAYKPKRDGSCSCGKRANCKKSGKHPCIRDWADEATTDRAKISIWLKEFPISNIGIVTGKKSGVVVLDVDPGTGGDESLEKVTRGHVSHETWQARTGSGGCHLYFQYPTDSGQIIRNSAGSLAPGLDIRSNRGMVIAPPSLHSLGRHYEWVYGLAPWECELAPLPDWLMQELDSCHRERRENRDHGDHSDDRSKGVGGVNALTGPEQSIIEYENLQTEVREAVDRVIAQTLPTGKGQRNHEVFRLAQMLQGIPSLSGCPLRSLKQIVGVWHKKALPVIGTLPFDETWSDFTSSWPNVKYPGGFDMKAIVDEVQKSPVHPAAVEMGYETPERRILVALCARLQDEAGDGPFFLSCAKAGELLRIHPRRANRILSNDLVVDGLLEVVEKGKLEGRRATRFRFIWKERSC